jgi:hypothetical protein
VTLRGRGINYDTGFFPGGKNSRVHFDLDVVKHEMHVIAHELHCSAVRISGGDPARISVAAEHAAAEGLEIWFAPFPCELTTDQLGPLLAECAERAESLRLGGATVVLVLGCEMSLFSAGFLPGATVYERIAGLSAPWRAPMRELGTKLNPFLADVVADARARFGGQITYASGTWEDIDWTPFDIVAVDAYRARMNALTYRSDLRRRVRRHHKPLAVTEFGCCTYAGAGKRGGMGWTIVDNSVTPPQLDGTYVRDEQEQVRYLTKCLDVFDAVGVDSAFWFTFATYGAPHRDDPRYDLDLGAYGVVKMLDDTTWEPKAVFHALAATYAQHLRHVKS